MNKLISEQELQAIEITIPTLARQAFRKAYARALKVRGHVLVVRNGQLGESNADGSFKVVRPLQAAVQVTIGATRTRTKHSKHSKHSKHD
jgi:hypothetical protein